MKVTENSQIPKYLHCVICKMSRTHTPAQLSDQTLNIPIKAELIGKCATFDDGPDAACYLKSN